MSFTVDLSRLVAKSKGNIDRAIHKVALDVFQGVVKKSPVDTGRFRGNWTVSIGSYSAQALDRTDKRRLGSLPGHESALRADAALTAFKAGAPIYITNSLPYADRLENGWSQQAPTGMVRLTLMEISAKYGT